MSDQISLLRAAAHPGNTDGVTATSPTMRYRPEKCEFPIHIGVFFDCTRNNQYGGGTPFPEVGENGGSTLGMGFGGATRASYVDVGVACRLDDLEKTGNRGHKNGKTNSPDMACSNGFRVDGGF